MSDKVAEVLEQIAAQKNIWQRINAIREGVGNVAKDIEVMEGGRYRAVSHDAVTRVLRDLMATHGVVSVPMLKSSTFENTGRESKGGTPLHRYVGHYDIWFVNADNPEDKVIVPQEAHALDYGDKAPGKAQSYATKYAMLKLFAIVTGEDDEERPEQESTPAIITEAQQQAMLEKVHEWFGDKGEARLQRYLVSQYGKTASIGAIPATHYEAVLKVLEANAARDQSKAAEATQEAAP